MEAFSCKNTLLCIADCVALGARDRVPRGGELVRRHSPCAQQIVFPELDLYIGRRGQGLARDGVCAVDCVRELESLCDVGGRARRNCCAERRKDCQALHGERMWVRESVLAALMPAAVFE